MVKSAVFSNGEKIRHMKTFMATISGFFSVSLFRTLSVKNVLPHKCQKWKE